MTSMFYLTNNININQDSKYQNSVEKNDIRIFYNDSMKVKSTDNSLCLYYSQAEELGLIDSSVINEIVNDFNANKTFKYTNLVNKYVFIFIDLDSGSLSAYTDLFKNINLYYHFSSFFILSDSLSAIKNSLETTTISKESIYHYLNFCYIPSPNTVYKEILKLGAAQVLNADMANLTHSIDRYWNIDYSNIQAGNDEELIGEIKDNIVKAVLQCKTSHKNSTFLSGGTDSTSITSIISKNSDTKLKSYSIGFYEEEYSELEFVDIAQKVLLHDSTKYKLSADEVYDLIFKLSGEFEEPFGNSSVLATYYCAKLSSHDTNDVMVAGDGGDEIFGGNERYAKDIYFQKYYNAPSIFKYPVEFLVSLLPGTSNRFLNRIKNFIKRSNTKNPERFYLDDSFSSDHFEELLTKNFRQDVKKSSSLEVVQKNYDYCDSKIELNRLMQLDQLMAIAENDLTKVNTSCGVNNIEVLYPFLNRELVEFMATMPSNLKVRGTDKRYGFKKAVSSYTPSEILDKKKQGFGVPLSVWFKTNKKFIDLAKDIFNSDSFESRDIFNKKFCLKLLDDHIKGSWDYSQELWIIINLELWLRNHA